MVALLEGRDPAGATCVVMNGNIVCVYTDQKMENDHGCHHELVERMGALILRAAMIYGLSRATPVSAIIKMQSFHNLQAEVVSADFAQSFPAFAQPMHEIIHDVFTPCAACLSASEQSARTEHHEEGGLNGRASEGDGTESRRTHREPPRVRRRAVAPRHCPRRRARRTRQWPAPRPRPRARPQRQTTCRSPRGAHGQAGQPWSSARTNAANCPRQVT